MNDKIMPSAPGRPEGVVVHDTIELTHFTDVQRMTGFQARVIAICAAVALCDAFSIQAVNYAGPSIRDAFGLSAAQLGVIFSISLFGMMLGSFGIGPVSDRFGRRIPMLILTVLFGLLTAAIAVSTSFSQLVILRFLDGCALGAALPNAYVLAAEYSPVRHRRLIVGLMMVGYTAGGLAAGAIAGPLVASHGWQSIFLVGGAAAVVTAVMGYFFVPDSLQFLISSERRRAQFDRVVARITPRPDLRIISTPPAKTQGILSSIKMLFTSDFRPLTISLWTLSFSVMLVIYLYMSWTPILLTDAGLGLDEAIMVTLMFNFGTVISAVAAGFFMDRHNPGLVLIALLLLGAFSLAIVGQAIGDVWGLRFTSVMVGLGVGGAMGGMNLLASTVYPGSARVTGSGMAISVGRLGSVAGPAIGAAWLSAGLQGLHIYYAALVPLAIALATAAYLSRQRVVNAEHSDI